MPYFASLDFVCPVYTNPSDYYILILKDSEEFLTKAWEECALQRTTLLDSCQLPKYNSGEAIRNDSHPFLHLG